MFAKKTLFLKPIVVAVITQFVLTGIPGKIFGSQIDSDQLRKKSATEASDGGVVKSVERDFIERIVTPDIKIFAENVKVGGKTKKDQEKNVGQTMLLSQVVEQQLAGALLGHSATREACVLEITKDVMAAFNTAGLDRKKALAEIERIAISRAAHAIDLFGEQIISRQLWNTVLSNAMKEFLDAAPTINREGNLIEAKRIAEARFNEVMNHRIKALLAEGVKEIPVCVGSSKATMDEIIKEVSDQLTVYFSDIDQTQIQWAMENGAIFYIPNEPPGKIGTGKAEDPENIRQVHQAIYDWLEKKYGKDAAKAMWGKSFVMMYGASVDDNNIDGIMAVKSARPDMIDVPLVHGVLFATYGKEVKKYLKVAQGVDRAAKRDNSKYFCFINLKNFADKDKTPPEEYIKEIYAVVNRGDIDATRTAFYIADTDRNLKDWKSALTKIETDFLLTTDAFWLSQLFYPAVVKESENIGEGYVKETLSYEAKAGDLLNPKLNLLFKDEFKEGDAYVFLKRNNKIFALGKENKKDHTLTTVSIDADLTSPAAKEEYYSTLLECVSKMSGKTGEFIELIEQDGNKLKRFLSSEAYSKPKPSDSNSVAAFTEEFTLGDKIKGTKYWFGDQAGFSQKLFQMEYRSKDAAAGSRATLITFKPSPKKAGYGMSLIVQPKQDVLINGAGTVGYEVAEAYRKVGFFVKGISVGTLNEKARDAYFNKGYTLFYYDTKEKEKFEKDNIKVVGGVEDALKVVDLVVDGSPEKGEENKKIYAKFPNVKVIYEGGEDEDIADSKFSFSSSTNYAENVGKKDTRVVSCNTTGLSRTAGQVAKEFSDMIIKVYLQRRGSDPNAAKTGPIDAITIDVKKPSHHAPDARTVLPKEIQDRIKVYESFASKNPTTHFHVHYVQLRAPGLNAEKVKEILKAQSRVGLVEFKKEFDTSNIYQLITNFIKRPQSFMAVAYVFSDNPELPGEVDFLLAVDQQTIVVPENANAAQAMFKLSLEAEPAVRVVNEAMGIDTIKSELEKIAPAKMAKKPSAPKAEVKLPIDVLTESDVTTLATIAIRDDLNSSKDAEGKIILGGKLLNGAKVINKDAERGNKVVVLSHQGRKKDGQGDKDFTEELDQHAKIMSRLIGKAIGYVPDLFNDAAISAIGRMKRGDILQLKNARSWETETNEKMSPAEHSQTPLIQNLSTVFDIVKFPNLAILHRYNVTIDGWPEDMPVILGDKVIKDIANIENVRQILLKSQPCLFIAGGAKIDDYLVLVDKGLESNLLAEVKTGGLFGELCLLAQGYKLGKPTMKILEKQFKKFESEKEGYGTGLEAMVKEIKDLLVKYQKRIDVPIDVAFINKDGQRQVIAIEEKHKTEAITDDYEIRDIGDATADKYVQDIDKAKSVLLKGPPGDVTKKETAVGSDKTYKAVREKQLKDAEFSSVLGGGDAGTTFDKLGIKKDKFSVEVDAGGALIFYLAEGPKGLPGLVAAERSKKYILEKANALGVDAKTYLNFKIASRKTFRAVDGVDFSGFVGIARGSFLTRWHEQQFNKALIIGPDFFKAFGASEALLKVTTLLGNGFKIGLYGEDAEQLKKLLGSSENIITANTLDEVISALREKGGVFSNNIVLLRSPNDSLDVGMAEKLVELKVKQVVSPEISTMGLTKAITELIPSQEVRQASADFYAKAAEKDVISKETYAKTKDLLLAELEAGNTFKFPEEVKLTQKVADEIKQDTLITKEFMDNI